MINATPVQVVMAQVKFDNRADDIAAQQGNIFLADGAPVTAEQAAEHLKGATVKGTQDFDGFTATYGTDQHGLHYVLIDGQAPDELRLLAVTHEECLPELLTTDQANARLNAARMYDGQGAFSEAFTVSFGRDREGRDILIAENQKEGGLHLLLTGPDWLTVEPCATLPQ